MMKKVVEMAEKKGFPKWQRFVMCSLMTDTKEEVALLKDDLQIW